ncbi:MAG: hypothetical protein D6705_11855 [Deltaproteobacteria bacterium]|nr:MAG: hypothetical protein D6705_11855 [Deltaproteobacteria bacterium]
MPFLHSIRWWTAAGLVTAATGCRGEDLSFDCDYQSERFAEEAAAEGALRDAPPEGGPYPVAVVVSETGLDRLVKAVVGEDIPFAGNVPLAGFDASFEPKGEPQVRILDVPGCVDCVFFDVEFYLSLADTGGGGVSSGVGSTRLGIPLYLQPGPDDVMELWADYDALRIESFDFVVAGFTSEEHEALAGAMRILLEEKIREQYDPTHIMDFEPWRLGTGDVRLVAQELFLFPDDATMAVGMQTNLALPEGAGLERPTLPEGAHLGLAFHGAIFEPLIERMIVEGEIPRRYDADGTPDEEGEFGITIQSIAGLPSPMPEVFRVMFRVWRTAGGYCGYALAQMDVTGAFDGRFLRMSPGPVAVLSGEGAGAVAAEDEELVAEHQGVVDNFKRAVAEQLELAVGLSAVDLPGHDVVLEAPVLDIEPDAVRMASDFFTVEEP